MIKRVKPIIFPSLIVFTTAVVSALTTTKVAAATTFGRLNFTSLGLQFKDSSGFITAIIKILIGAVGVGFLIFFLMGALKYVTSSGDKKAVMAAQGTITNALIGLVLAAALFAIMSLLESILGVKFLNVSI